MKLLDAGEVLPDKMVLDLAALKLAGRQCQKSGWVLEGISAAAGMEQLEEAIVMATEVSLIWLCASLSHASGVILLDLDLRVRCASLLCSPPCGASLLWLVLIALL